MTDPGAGPFYCIQCGYDLCDFRHAMGEPITCPECAHVTDPYNPRAPRIKRQHLAKSFLVVFAVSLLCGVPIGLVPLTYVSLFVFAAPLLLIPAAIAQGMLNRAPGDQHRRLTWTLGWAMGLGVLAGGALWVVWLII